MASSLQSLTPPPFSAFHSRRSYSPSLSLSLAFRRDYRRFSGGRREVVRAAVEKEVQGASAAYAKEMERLSAKESLLLAFKDSGGFEGLVSGKTTDMQRIDVNERIIGLERLNPTPRPTTSPVLEGRWNFEWFGSGSPGLFTAKFLIEKFPSTVANLSKMDVVIKDGYAKVTAMMKLLNSIESKVVVSTKLTVEGPLRMKEEYVEGVIESPRVDEGTIPEQLRGVFDQAASTLQQLPVPITDTLASGLKIPLSGTFQRLFMISYLDDEILIIRDIAGVPEVLTKLDAVMHVKRCWSKWMSSWYKEEINNECLLSSDYMNSSPVYVMKYDLIYHAPFCG